MLYLSNHHFVVIEPITRTLFSGDSFGVAYPKILKREGDVILASTSPTDFDGEAALASVNWILAQDPSQIGLTHYGFITKDKISTFAEILMDQIRYSLELMQQARVEKLSVEQVRQRLEAFTVRYFGMRGIHLDEEDLKYLEIDLKVNAQGVHYAANASSLKK